MKTIALETDYLIVGAGAMGMAFADTLQTQTSARIVMVDRRYQPGGHWNDAYSFVRLHQPSYFYGVNSRNLGNDTIDATGWNKGLAEMASGAEVCAYFDQVMRQQFLPSGRVSFYPLCDYQGNSRFASLAANIQYEVRAKKIVDSTYMNVSVPGTRPPDYAVAEGVHCVPINTLPQQVNRRWRRYVIVGGGKTGIDACLFLLENQIDPDKIHWIVPRDAWLHDRAQWQVGSMFEQSLGRTIGEFLAGIGEADSIDDVFTRLNARRVLVRIDANQRPTAYRCATVTQDELTQLRRIKNVIRKGRVKGIEPDHIELDRGIEATDAHSLHVDCTADGAARVAPKPIFVGENITLQSVRWCQQVFSAALISHVESTYQDDKTKNELCTPIPHPNSHYDFLRTAYLNMNNGGRWGRQTPIREWLKHARLD